MKMARIVAIATLVGLANPWGALPASAATPVTVVADGFIGPLQISVGTNGTLYVGQAFIGTLTTLDRQGRRTDLAFGVGGGEIAGVDAKGGGTAVYTSSNATEEEPATFATLNRVLPNGRTRVIADLLDYEETVNPDQVNSYGFTTALPEGCDWPIEELGPPSYTGIVETHPYAVAIGGGGYYVADAAANAVLRVDAKGRVSTVAVLPPQPFDVTAEIAGAFGLDDCVIGLTYAAEPVPTDVEIGPDGMLYVTTLDGVDAGSVYRIDPSTGVSTVVAAGFVSATNLAIGPDGSIYVAELFADQVSKVVAGVPVKIADVVNPAGLEFAQGQLWVSYDVFGNGTVGTIAI